MRTAFIRCEISGFRAAHVEYDDLQGGPKSKSLFRVVNNPIPSNQF